MRGRRGTRPTTWQLVREDLATHGSAGHPGWHALVHYRLGTAAYSGRGARHRLGRLVYRLTRPVVVGFYNELLPKTRLGRRLHLPHPHGVVLNGRCVVGDDCLIRHNVTLGAASDTRSGVPTLGDRVQLGPGAIVMGAVTIGDDVLIGPNAVVVHDVPAGSRVLAPAATARPPRGAPVDRTIDLTGQQAGAADQPSRPAPG